MAKPAVVTPLRAARQARNLTLDELSAATGIDTGNLSRIERSVRGCSAAVAERLVKAIGRKHIDEMQVLYPKRYMQLPRPRSQRGL